MRGNGRHAATLLAAMVGCGGNFNASGSGNATFAVIRNDREDAQLRVNVVFTSRSATHASGGFLDLKIANVSCPLLLDGSGNVVSGRICRIASDNWVIAGGGVVGASLTLSGYPADNRESVTTRFTLAYPEVVEAGVPDAGTSDADATPDVPRADVPLRGVDCFTLCRLQSTCGSSIQSFCENECDNARRVMSGRCEPSLLDLQRCAPSSRISCAGGTSGLQRFTNCSFEYSNVLRCLQGF